MNECQKMMDAAHARLESSELNQLDDRTLMLLFHQTNWKRMNAQKRLMAMQEVENRRAKADGRPPVTIYIDLKMQPNTLGGYQRLPNGKEVIVLNHRFFTAGKLFSRSNMSIYNAASALNTVLHEGRHAFQMHAVREAFASVSEKVRMEWAAFMPSENGMYTSEDPLIYFLQSIEIDARRFARRKTAQVSQFFNGIGAPDPNFRLQTIKDVQLEAYVINRVRAVMTREMIDQYEQKVLDHFKKSHPELNVKELGLFDHVRFILDHPEISDPKEMLDRLDRMADEKLALKDGKHLNRLKDNRLNGLKV